MKTVFLFLENQSYISDLLNTKYIRYLGDKFRVVVFLPERIDNGGYYRNSNIEYIKFPEIRSRFWVVFDELFRTELLKKFNDNIAVQWRNRRASDPRRLFLRKISFLFPKIIFTPALFSFLERLFLPKYKLFLKYAREFKPSLVLTATPGLSALDVYAIHCAKKYGIPSVATNFGWDNLVVYPRHIRKTDYLFCWNSAQKEQAIKLHGFKEGRVFVTGIPRFDYYYIKQKNEPTREEFLKNKNLDPNLKTVFFASKPHGGFYRKFIESFIKWNDNNEFGQRVNLFVRMHPFESMESYNDFINIPNLHVEYAGKRKSGVKEKIEMDEEDLFNTKYTLKYTDVHFNIYSTMSIESCIFDKPVVNAILIPEYEEVFEFPHYKPIVEKGAVRVARSMEEIKNYIIMYLKNPKLDSENRTEIVRMLADPTDGFSYKRKVDLLGEIFAK